MFAKLFSRNYSLKSIESAVPSFSSVNRVPKAVFGSIHVKLQAPSSITISQDTFFNLEHRGEFYKFVKMAKDKRVGIFISESTQCQGCDFPECQPNIQNMSTLYVATSYSEYLRNKDNVKTVFYSPIKPYNLNVEPMVSSINDIGTFI